MVTAALLDLAISGGALIAHKAADLLLPPLAVTSYSYPDDS